MDNRWSEKYFSFQLRWAIKDYLKYPWQPQKWDSLFPDTAGPVEPPWIWSAALHYMSSHNWTTHPMLSSTTGVKNCFGNMNSLNSLPQQ